MKSTASRGSLRRVLSFGLVGAFSLSSIVLNEPAAADETPRVQTQEVSSGTYQFHINPSEGGTFDFTVKNAPEGAPLTMRVPSVLQAAELPEGSEHSWLGASGQQAYVIPTAETTRPRSEGRYGISVGPFVGAGVEGKSLSLVEVVAPVGGTYTGYVPAFRASDLNAPPADARGFGTGTQANGELQGTTFPLILTTEPFAQRFTAEGLYCVTYRAAFTPAGGSESQTLDLTQRYAVGDDIAADAPCGGAPEEYPRDGEPEPEPEPSEPTTVSLGGVVWNDANRNQVRDSDESGIAGYRVFIWKGERRVQDGSGQSLVATTDDAGRYLFEGLPVLTDGQETYRVELQRFGTDLENGLTTPSMRVTSSDLSVPGSSQMNLDFGLAHNGTTSQRVLFSGHADLLKPQIDTTGGAQSIHLRAKADDLVPQINEWEDLIVFIGDHEKGRLPGGYEFIGAAGQEVWNSPVAGGSPWIGMSSEDASLPTALGSDGVLMFRLDAVTGLGGGQAPGEVALWEGNSAEQPRLLFSTREGLPRSTPYGLLGHTHFNWTFTAPGTYCLAFGVEARLPDSGQKLTDNRQLTIVVGNDINPNTVQSCENSGSYPQSGTRSFIENDEAAPVVLEGITNSNRQHPRLMLRESDGVSIVQNVGDPSGKLGLIQVDDVVLHGATARVNRGYYSAGVLSFDGAETRADVTWRITDVKGPGEIRTSPSYVPLQEYFDTGLGRTDINVWAGGSLRHPLIETSRPGKYCVAMQWESETAAGATIVEDAVLTLAVDGPLDPQDLFWDESGELVSAGEVWRASEQGALDATCVQDPDSWTQPHEVENPNEEVDEPDNPDDDLPGEGGPGGEVPGGDHSDEGKPDSGQPGDGSPGGDAPGGGGQSGGDQPGTDKPGDDPAGNAQTGGQVPGSGGTTDGISPVPDAQLTEGNRGGVRVPDAASVGQRIAVEVGQGHAGQRVRVWLHSQPVLLDTVTVDEAGAVSVTIPKAAVLGAHKLVVQALDGRLIGWDDLEIRALSPSSSDSERLSDTGVGALLPMIAMAVILLALGAAVYVGSGGDGRGSRLGVRRS
ncbi:choice-of-anchor M domain-containing protein [Populibacterium corticicola]|uniref:Choice-of-anchor M domain-containing protein n=1 Tax=Populibacterium corticicola TaxID=1812826 RepID=A0ABW5XGE0_9MICO